MGGAARNAARDGGLGQFSVLQGVFTVAGAAITAAGAVGGSFIQADAAKYAARTAAKSQLQQTLAETQAQLKIQQAQLEAAQAMQTQQIEATKVIHTQDIVHQERQAAVTAQTTSQAIDSGTVLLAILGVGAAMAFVMSQRRRGGDDE